MELALLLVPGAFAFANRYFRGEGTIDRWVWVSGNCVAAFALTLNPVIAAGWLLLILGYTVPPTHPLISAAVRGQPPVRASSWVFNWMIAQAIEINRRLPAKPVTEWWYRFAVVYGALRFVFMAPGVALLTGALGPVALLGLGFALQGWFACLGGRMGRHFQAHEGMGWALYEVLIGWLLGCYLVVIVLAEGGMLS